MPILSQVSSITLGIGLAYLAPFLREHLSPTLQALRLIQPTHPAPWVCTPHNYTTHLVSLDPLLISITDFITPAEAALITAAGAPRLGPSPVTGYGTGDKSQARTSWSAPLPEDDLAVQCVLSRAESFMGTLMAPGRDEMGVAQLVHYTDGQKFDLHHDWFRQPRMKDGDGGRQRLYNRVATFFVILQANCTAGETFFPQVKAISSQDRAEKGAARQAWREDEDGGLKFPPVAGNALFWVNLLANGSGDARTLHAGLPVGEGTKTAMNIWPRMFFGPEA